MKNTVILTAAFAALLSFAACERENLSDPQAAGEGIRLTLSCADISTKAATDKPGVGNENLIKTVDVFLFSNSYTDFR